MRWVTAFLDTAQGQAQQVESFWCRVTGYRLSPRRGARGEFASLLPVDGDPHLKVQTVMQQSPGGLHVDLHTDDVPALAARAEALGASARHLDAGYVVCGSPGGMTFCLVGHPGSRTTSSVASGDRTAWRSSSCCSGSTTRNRPSSDLDLGSDDYLAETNRHLALGATAVRRTPHWVTRRDPSGRLYCVTRHPVGEPAV